jgi:hypothetical protein
MAEGKKMKTTSLILTLAVASLLTVRRSSTASRDIGPKEAAEAAPQNITVMSGDVPVTLALDTFQIPFDLVLPTH